MTAIVVAACPACGAPSRPGANYCWLCGRPSAAGKPSIAGSIAKGAVAVVGAVLLAIGASVLVLVASLIAFLFVCSQILKGDL
jgi:hypothetical protein